MAFKSDRAQKMIKATETYIKAWKPEVAAADAAHQLNPYSELAAPPAGTKEVPTRLEVLLSECVDPRGILYLSDGVVHTQSRMKSIKDLAEHIRQRYAAYEHVDHTPFALAVNEEESEAFLGVRYMAQNTGPILGREPSKQSSSGILLERLGFNMDGKITTALVCRQMTKEEVEAMTYNPGAVHEPKVMDEEIFAPEASLTTAEVATMDQNLKQWVRTWDLEAEAELSHLEEILDPQVRQLNAYGLGKHAIPFAGVAGARGAIRSAHERVDNKNYLISHAVCTDRRAGFAHWRAQCLDGTTRMLEAVEGLDYFKFNERGQIALIVSFTMRPYANLKPDQDIRNKGVD